MSFEALINNYFIESIYNLNLSSIPMPRRFQDDDNNALNDVNENSKIRYSETTREVNDDTS